MPLNPRILAAVAGIVLLTGSAVGVTYVAGAGPFQGPPAPELESFESAGPACANGNGTGYSFELTPADGGSHLAIEGEVEVPDLAHDVGDASVERTGPANYTFSVETLEPDNGTMGAMCLGTVEYTADLTIPKEANSTFSVAVLVDGEQKAILRNGPNGSGVGMSASAGDDAR